jgi:hypothetical protein
MPCTLDASKSANGIGLLCTDSDNHQARYAPPGPPGPPPRLSGRHRIGWAMQRVAIHPSDMATAQRVKHAPTVVRGAPLVFPLHCWRLSDFS